MEELSKAQKYPGDTLVTDQQKKLVTDKGNTLVTDPPYDNLLTPVVTRTVNLIRGYIDASGKYVLGESGSIPEALESTFLDICVVEAWKRLGGALLDIEEQRSKSYEDAIERLKAVARGEFGIAEPETPSDEERQGEVFKGGSDPETFKL